MPEIRRVSHLLPERQGRDLGTSESSGGSREGSRVWVKGISRVSSKWVCRNRKGIYCAEPLSAVISRVLTSELAPHGKGLTDGESSSPAV